MAGEMKQGGNVARFDCARSARHRLSCRREARRSRATLEDRWTGEFELGGYPRHVTITLDNHGDAAATAKFVVVGKQTTDVPVDLVAEEGNFLRIESQANRIVFEGRFVKESGEIKGRLEMGPLELPLVLRRASGRAS